MAENEGPNESDNQLRKFGLFGLVVVNLVVYTAVGIGLGYLVYSKLHFPAWLMMITGMGGLVLAMMQIYRLFQKDMQ